jgi:hypothetical protein
LCTGKKCFHAMRVTPSTKITAVRRRKQRIQCVLLDQSHPALPHLGGAVIGKQPHIRPTSVTMPDKSSAVRPPAAYLDPGRELFRCA